MRKKVTIPAADLLKEVGSNNALVDVYLHPHENKIIIVEKKEITFSNLRRIMSTTNLIADVELDAEKKNLIVETEKEIRLGDSDQFILSENEVSYIGVGQSSKTNRARENSLRLKAINKHSQSE
ncbi:hypothetical protein M2444_004682 [Paenibacillus sp. PastF-3]|uniref:hypothetical protein n=1 Tax=unclassified Paenibacillus TaxID=185978 RepID=UPI000BA16C26|nr:MULTISPECIES: hypothetical protein [unclassified Paenibacillus]MDH6372853.1 hypothetical protein [Paenibacillus sp. PastF-3]OZQ97428.1 hypothetical protein CA598_06430 [Paenibacillus sp. VTT E-133291]